MNRQEEAERELTHVRDAIRQTSARRASLLDVCATLDVPFAPPPPPPQAAVVAAAAAAAAAAASSGRAMLPPAAPDADDDTAAGTAAARHGAAGDAVAAVGAAGVTAAGVAAAAAADMEWRTTRLECLMYRVLWVSEAVKMFQAQYSPRQSTHHYDLFIRATHWAKQLSEEYEESIRAYCCELERLRARLRDVAAVDLGYEIGSAALEVARRRVEAAAHAAREAASLTLLKELEEEEERRKATATGKDGRDAGAARDAGAGKKATANKKAAIKATAADLKKQKERERELVRTCSCCCMLLPTVSYTSGLQGLRRPCLLRFRFLTLAPSHRQIATLLFVCATGKAGRRRGPQACRGGGQGARGGGAACTRGRHRGGAGASPARAGGAGDAARGGGHPGRPGGQSAGAAAT